MERSTPRRLLRFIVHVQGTENLRAQTPANPPIGSAHPNSPHLPVEMNMAHFRGTSLATKCSVPARDYSYRRPGTKRSQAIMGHISTAKFASPEAERHGRARTTSVHPQQPLPIDTGYIRGYEGTRRVSYFVFLISPRCWVRSTWRPATPTEKGWRSPGPWSNQLQPCSRHYHSHMA